MKFAYSDTHGVVGADSSSRGRGGPRESPRGLPGRAGADLMAREMKLNEVVGPWVPRHPRHPRGLIVGPAAREPRPELPRGISHAL